MRFVGEICETCVAGRIGKKFPGRATLSYCKRCERLHTPTGYKAFGRESMADALAKVLCGSKCSIAVKSFDNDHADVEVTYHVDDQDVKFGKSIELDMHYDICQTCYRKSSGYYEAIVQLRGDPQRTQRLANKITASMEKGEGFIGKVERVDGGLDVYVSDKKLLAEFLTANKIRSSASYTLYGIKNGRKVYRNTYLVRLD